MPGVPACPGCGRELEESGSCPSCHWYEAKARFERRPRMGLARHYLPPPSAELADGAENRPGMPLLSLNPPPIDGAPQPPAKTPLKPGGKMRSKPTFPPEPPSEHLEPLPTELERSWRRIAFTNGMASESRFLEQRTEAAHRAFVRILDRVCPLDPVGEWPDPVVEVFGRRYNGGGR
jgi:hypothetical protein